MSTKTLKRWVLRLVVLEGVLCTATLLMKDATTDLRLSFLLFVIFVNYPGIILAHWLGLGAKGAWGVMPDPHPVITLVVVFGFSLVFYVTCLWLLTLVNVRNDDLKQAKTRNVPGHRGSADVAGGDSTAGR